MKTGLSENSVFSEFHPDAVVLFNVCSNMEKVMALIFCFCTVTYFIEDTEVEHVETYLKNEVDI